MLCAKAGLAEEMDDRFAQKKDSISAIFESRLDGVFSGIASVWMHQADVAEE
jgi:hypothetical protein